MQKVRFFLGLGLLGALSVFAQDPALAELRSVSARTAPADYMAQGKAGEFTVAADFVSHSVPTAHGTFTSEDYVVVEVAFYGPAGSKLKLAFSDFSLKINDRKMPIPGQPNGVVFRSLTDPEWQPPKVEEDKSKRPAGEPPPPKMPFPLRRAMEQKVTKAAMPEGDRELPVAGLLFFPYRGKDAGITAVELLYNGAAGSTVLKFER
jgi:hypothetical protein